MHNNSHWVNSTRLLVHEDEQALSHGGMIDRRIDSGTKLKACWLLALALYMTRNATPCQIYAYSRSPVVIRQNFFFLTSPETHPEDQSHGSNVLKKKKTNIIVCILTGHFPRRHHARCFLSSCPHKSHDSQRPMRSRWPAVP